MRCVLPLSVISGGVDLLHHTDDPQAQRRHLKVLKSATAGMVRLMDDVLDISALERGQVRLDVVPMDLSSLLRTLKTEFADSAKGKGLYMSLEGHAPDVRVSGDPQRVRQVLSNLVDNAIKYTSSGGISMAIEDRGDQVQVVVADTGSGIAEADQESVFEPYSRADARGTVVPDWGWRSPAPWSSAWAPGSIWSRSSTRARPSRSCCPRLETQPIPSSTRLERRFVPIGETGFEPATP